MDIAEQIKVLSQVGTLAISHEPDFENFHFEKNPRPGYLYKVSLADCVLIDVDKELLEHSLFKDRANMERTEDRFTAYRLRPEFQAQIEGMRQELSVSAKTLEKAVTSLFGMVAEDGKVVEASYDDGVSEVRDRSYYMLDEHRRWNKLEQIWGDDGFEGYKVTGPKLVFA